METVVSFISYVVGPLNIVLVRIPKNGSALYAVQSPVLLSSPTRLVIFILVASALASLPFW